MTIAAFDFSHLFIIYLYSILFGDTTQSCNDSFYKLEYLQIILKFPYLALHG